MSAKVKKGMGQAPTVEQINADILTQLASRYWAPHSPIPRLPFDPKVRLIAMSTKVSNPEGQPPGKLKKRQRFHPQLELFN